MVKTPPFPSRGHKLGPFSGSLGGASGEESAFQRRIHRFDPWVRKSPWKRKWQPTLVFVPGKVRGQRSLGGYSPWGHKELDTTERPEEHRELRFPCAWQCSLKKKFKVSCFIFKHINIYLRDITHIKSLLSCPRLF